MCRWFSRRRTARPASGDDDLERFFTDAEEARARFDDLRSGSWEGRRLLVVHGVGAVGKTSLLRMYRLACRRDGIPVALVGGEEAASAVDLIDRWQADLAADGVGLAATAASLDHYRKVAAKVAEEASKAGQAHAEAAAQLSRAAAKGAVRVAASALPVAGPVVEAVGSEGVEAVLNLVRATLSRADFRFFLDPAPRLTEDFLTDLERAAARQRLALMLDTVERTAALHDWTGELVRQLPAGVLFVAAGRELPRWDGVWPGWVARAEVIELTEMDDANVEQLVRRYYGLFGRGDPSPEQVAAVVRFARGLPMAATTAVRLWVNHQLTDLSPVGTGAIADLADRLLEGVPQDTRPAFEAAALVRHFNADVLADVLAADDVGALYEELRRWPFTRARQEGLAIHDTMREVMDEALRVRSRKRHRELHERAAAHHEALLAAGDGHSREQHQLEWLYHTIAADEAAGVEALVALAEELVRYLWVGRLRALCNDAATYRLQLEASRLWRDYYAARLEQLEGRVSKAEQAYGRIAEHHEAPPRLRAYALCDLGAIAVAFDRLAQPGGPEHARGMIDRSRAAHPELDGKLVTNLVSLANLSNASAAWDDSLAHLSALGGYAQAHADAYGLATASHKKSAIHALRGHWERFLHERRESEEAARRLGDPAALRMQVVYLTWPLVYLGRCRAAQEANEEALRLAVLTEEKELMVTIRESAGLAHGMGDDFVAAGAAFAEAWNFYDNYHVPGGQDDSAERYVRALLSFRGLVALRQGRLDAAQADLDEALRIKHALDDRIGIPELHVWTGHVHELRGDLPAAAAAYERAIALRHLGRTHFTAIAHASLARVHLKRNDRAVAEQLAGRADTFAASGTQHDVLATTALLRGHLALRQGGQAQAHYRQALSHGLAFNRFLLDELLAGRPQGSVHTPVIAAALEAGTRGRQLLADLHGWWRHAETREADPVTVVPAHTSVLHAEQAARRGEPGAGRSQRTVLEQLGQALERD
jgi:tetratricopeptide (TPR) repeat protein